MARVEAAYAEAVPASWRAAAGVRFDLIGGSTSWSLTNGRMEISQFHANGDYAHLKAVLAHEFGHIVAFRWGTQAFLGAAPEGWPTFGPSPEESWSDCVSLALSGLNDPSPGLPSCSGASLAWTADWLAAGPAAHTRTN